MVSTSNVGGSSAERRFETEAVLVAALKRHEPEAAVDLVRRCRGPLLSVARRYLSREADAEDVVQDAFLQAFRALPRFRGDASLSTWLFRITVNQALMTLRRQARRGEPPRPPGIPDAATWLMGQPDPDPGPERQLIESERRDLVVASVSYLPRRYEVVIRLIYYDGLDTGAAARRLGITPNAVKQRLRRARRRLGVILRNGSAGLPSGGPAAGSASAAAVHPAEHEPVRQVGAEARRRCA